MNMLFDKRGNLSFVRVSVVIAVVGGLLLVGGYVSFLLDQQTRNSPLEIDLPPGAEQWGAPDVYSNSWRKTFYQVPDGDIDEIVAFYNQKMIDHYGVDETTGPEQCSRQPSFGEYEDYEPGAGNIPYSFECMFDRGGLNATQWTRVTIHPGVYDPDEFRNSEGTVVLIYEQRWES